MPRQYFFKTKKAYSLQVFDLVDYVHAFRKPFSSIRTTLLSFVLAFVGALTFGLVFLFLKGFIIESLRNQLHARHELPHFEFSSAVRYFVDGLKFGVAEFVYLLPGIIVLLIGFGGLLATVLTNFVFGSGEIDTLLVSQALISSFVFLLIGGVFLFLGWILSLMAIVNMAEEDKFKAAFNLGVIFQKMFNIKFLVALIVSVAYFFIVWFVFVFLSVLSLGFLGLLLGPGLFYSYSLSVYTIMADVFVEVH